MPPALTLRNVAGFGLALLFACDVLAAVGSVQFVSGDVKVRDAAGKVRAAQKGQAINEGDAILTGSGASAQLKMSDDGILAIRPETELKIDTYRFVGKEDGTENALMSLLKGGFRTITGVIGRTNKDNYRVRTTTATIGIRGTDHEPFVILPVTAGAPQPPAPPGTYDKVNVGEAYISSPLGTVNVSQNQVGFAAPNLAPTILPVMPEFFRATPPIQASAPATGTTATTSTTTEVRETAVVDSTATVTSPTTTTTATTTTLTAETVQQPVTGTASGTDLNVNLTDQTVSTSSGSTAQVEQGAFAIQAQTAADDALLAANSAAASFTSIQTIQTSANSTLSTINSLTVSTAPAASAISTVSGTISTAQTAVTNVNTLAAVDTGMAASNASAASGLASTSASRAALAQANVAGGFADAVYALPANTATQSANTSVQTANASVQTAAGDVTTQNTLFITAKTDASSALNTANTQLASANAQLGTANTNITVLGTAQSTSNSLSSAINTALGSAQTASSLAQQAAANAQSAATLALTLQNAGDFTGAQAALATAQAELANAQNSAAQAAAQQSPAQTAASGLPAQLTAAQTAYSAANAAVTASVSAATSAQSSAGTATTNAATATAAQTAAVTAVGTTSTQLANVQSVANTVAANYIQAQYSNPAVASSNFRNFVSSQKPVTGGTELASIGPFQPQANPISNTIYVLNENKDLIEIRSNLYERIGLNYAAQTPIADTNIRFTGGAAKDHFHASDGTIYMGRWQGGQIDVTDLATSGTVLPFSDPLGLTSAHWVIALVPGNSAMSTALAPINNVQTLLGTASYTLAAATHPTDSFGNVGTLNSASLSANFTSQTVDTSVGLSFSTSDPVNISARNLDITGSATNTPIFRDEFRGSFSTSNCTGTGCGSNPYSGFFFGGFGASASGGTTTGAVGTGAGLGYRFFPVPASIPSQPFSDLIDGAAVFTTTSAPAQGVNPTPVCSTCAFRSSVFYPIDGTSAGLTFFAFSGVPALGGTSTIPSANYVFDSSGNLVRVLTSSWNAFERATGSQCTGGAPCLTAPGPTATANTMLTMAGGTVGTGGATFSSSTVISSTTATERYSDATSIRMGRYEGGTVIVQDLQTDDRLDTTLTGPSGPRSVHWAVREQPTSIPISGSFDFTPTFATKPTDSFGSTNGALLNAQLTANFTDMTVRPLVRVSINGQALSANASGVPIFPGSFGFNVSSASATNTTFNPSAPVALQVGCSGINCAPSPAAGGRPYGGRITGGFSGDATADGAFFRYTFNTRFDPANPTDVATAASLSRPINDYINGLVAFGKGAQVAQPAPSGAASVGTAYFHMPTTGTYGTNDFAHSTDYQTSPTSFTITGGNLVSVSSDPAFDFPVKSESISGGTPVSGGVTVTGQDIALAATGIVFGRYDAMKADTTGTLATVTGSEELNDVATSFSRNILGSYHWFKGPEPFPFGISSALTGTATYGLAGHTPPTDQNSLTGSVSTVSTDTNLSVDFNKQAVTLNMKVTMPPSTGPVPGTSNRVWIANAPNIRLQDFDAGFSAFSGAAAGSHQSLTVTLNSGTNAFGEIHGALTGTGLNGAGVGYAFGGSDPLNSNSHEHVNGALAFALSSYDPGPTALAPSGSSINLDDVWYRVGLVSSGLLPAGQFESESNHSIQPFFGSVLRTSVNASGLPVAFDARRPRVFPSGCTSGCFVSDIPTRLSIVPFDVATVATALSTTATPASLVDTGFDQGTGIRWGRYAGGKVAVFDRIAVLPLALIDTTSQPMHFLMTAPQTGPVALPIAGTANYVLAGNTNPTDNFGNVGTLGSATFNADFGAQTVSSSVGLTVNSQTWSASVTNAPILRGTFIFAQKLLGGGGTQVPLTVTSSLGTNTAGTLVGGFTGTSGQGAGLAYSLNFNGNTGTTVSGVAAFRRP